MSSSFLEDGEYDIQVETGFNATMNNYYRNNSWSRKRFK